jgi:hypothetical protein
LHCNVEIKLVAHKLGLGRRRAPRRGEPHRNLAILDAQPQDLRKVFPDHAVRRHLVGEVRQYQRTPIAQALSRCHVQHVIPCEVVAKCTHKFSDKVVRIRRLIEPQNGAQHTAQRERTHDHFGFRSHAHVPLGVAREEATLDARPLVGRR